MMHLALGIGQSAHHSRKRHWRTGNKSVLCPKHFEKKMDQIPL